MTSLRSFAALLTGAAIVIGAAAQEPKQSQPRNDTPAFPDVADLLKQLPANLDPKQVEELKNALEKFRDAPQTFRFAEEGKALEDARKALEEARKAAEGARKDALQVRPPERFRPGAGRGRLGVHVAVPSPTIVDQFGLDQDHGLVIVDVAPDSAAAKGGLKAHDVLVEFNGKPVPSNLEEFVRQLDEIKADAKVDAVVWRKGKKETVKEIALPEAPKVAERPERREGRPFDFPGFRERGVEGNVLTLSRQGDRVTAHQREGATSFSVTGKLADGKFTVESITVAEGRNRSDSYDSLDKVPEKERAKVKGLIESAEKLSGESKDRRGER